MSNKLLALKREGKISEGEYNTWVLYCGNDVGVRYLKSQFDSILMEEPAMPTNDLFAWHDGRRSVWRDIKRMIDHVNVLIEGGANE